jgi:ABC-type proline/glycine betaine transport system permease subunit
MSKLHEFVPMAGDVLVIWAGCVTLAMLIAVLLSAWVTRPTRIQRAVQSRQLPMLIEEDTAA